MWNDMLDVSQKCSWDCLLRGGILRSSMRYLITRLAQVCDDQTAKPATHKCHRCARLFWSHLGICFCDNNLSMYVMFLCPGQHAPKLHNTQTALLSNAGQVMQLWPRAASLEVPRLHDWGISPSYGADTPGLCREPAGQRLGWTLIADLDLKLKLDADLKLGSDHRAQEISLQSINVCHQHAAACHNSYEQQYSLLISTCVRTNSQTTLVETQNRLRHFRSLRWSCAEQNALICFLSWTWNAYHVHSSWTHGEEDRWFLKQQIQSWSKSVCTSMYINIHLSLLHRPEFGYTPIPCKQYPTARQAPWLCHSRNPRKEQTIHRYLNTCHVCFVQGLLRYFRTRPAQLTTYQHNTFQTFVEDVVQAGGHNRCGDSADSPLLWFWILGR